MRYLFLHWYYLLSEEGVSAKPAGVRFSWGKDCPLWDIVCRLNGGRSGSVRNQGVVSEIFSHIRKHKSRWREASGAVGTREAVLSEMPEPPECLHLLSPCEVFPAISGSFRSSPSLPLLPLTILQVCSNSTNEGSRDFSSSLPWQRPFKSMVNNLTTHFTLQQD